MNICRAPHLEMSPKLFTMATIALFSASEQTHFALVVCHSEWVGNAVIPWKKVATDHQLHSRELAVMLGTVISGKEADHQLHSREFAVMWKRSSQAKKWIIIQLHSRELAAMWKRSSQTKKWIIIQLHSRELAAMWKRSSQAKKKTISYIPGN